MQWLYCILDKDVLVTTTLRADYTLTPDWDLLARILIKHTVHRNLTLDAIKNKKKIEHYLWKRNTPLYQIQNLSSSPK